MASAADSPQYVGWLDTFNVRKYASAALQAEPPAHLAEVRVSVARPQKRAGRHGRAATAALPVRRSAQGHDVPRRLPWRRLYAACDGRYLRLYYSAPRDSPAQASPERKPAGSTRFAPGTAAAAFGGARPAPGDLFCAIDLVANALVRCNHAEMRHVVATARAQARLQAGAGRAGRGDDEAVPVLPGARTASAGATGAPSAGGAGRFMLACTLGMPGALAAATGQPTIASLTATASAATAAFVALRAPGDVDAACWLRAAARARERPLKHIDALGLCFRRHRPGTAAAAVEEAMGAGAGLGAAATLPPTLPLAVALGPAARASGGSTADRVSQPGPRPAPGQQPSARLESWQRPPPLRIDSPSPPPNEPDGAGAGEYEPNGLWAKLASPSSAAASGASDAGGAVRQRSGRGGLSGSVLFSVPAGAGTSAGPGARSSPSRMATASPPMPASSASDSDSTAERAPAPASAATLAGALLGRRRTGRSSKGRRWREALEKLRAIRALEGRNELPDAAVTLQRAHSPEPESPDHPESPERRGRRRRRARVAMHTPPRVGQGLGITSPEQITRRLL